MSPDKERTYDERIAPVSAFLRQILPEDRPTLITALKQAEAYYTEVLEVRVLAHEALQNERLRMLHPKDKEMTDFDRRIHLEANTSGLQVTYERSAGLEKALEQRISVIQVMLQ